MLQEWSNPSSFSFSPSFGIGGCTTSNLAATLKETIQKEIYAKAKTISDMYKNIAFLARNLKKHEDLYEKLANKTLDDAILPLQQFVNMVPTLGDRNLINELSDAKLLIAQAKKAAFKTQRNYLCYEEKQAKLIAELNTTLYNRVGSIFVNNIYIKCNANSPATCNDFNNFFKCVSLELNDLQVFISKTYKEAFELNITATTKDVKYKLRVETWYKEDATIQINIVIKALTEWLIDVNQQNELLKRRCDEVTIMQVKNQYNDLLPNLTEAADCIANASFIQKNTNYCSDVYFCGKMQIALDVFLNPVTTNDNVLISFNTATKEYYAKALQQLKSFISNKFKTIDNGIEVVRNETNMFDNVRKKLSNPYILSNMCNATNFPEKSYCLCVSNYGMEQIKLLSSIVSNANRLCADSKLDVVQGTSNVLEYVLKLVKETKTEAEAEGASIIKLNEFAN